LVIAGTLRDLTSCFIAAQNLLDAATADAASITDALDATELAQLNRALEQRQDKRPQKSDLRGSGSIEQDADTILFLHREDYYDAETEDQNVMEVIVSKQRDGELGKVQLYFNKETGKLLPFENEIGGR
jgi:replicative DNA helicase